MNEKEKLMRKIQESSFVALECNLYLDCHPDNQKAQSRRDMAVRAMNENIKKYESAYGPLTAFSDSASHGKKWTSGAWPWQNWED